MTQMTVREARERKRPPMTQEDLAERSGVDQTYISLIERLLRHPSNEIKKRLAKALGIRPVQLRFSEPQPGDISTRAGDRVGHDLERRVG
jgi:transcriptional regulator with XRE-family HTH domain